MSVYNLNGASIIQAFDSDSTSRNNIYDVYGALISKDSGTPDASTDYQQTVLAARDAWISDYSANDSTIPLIVHTDQHGTLTKDFGKSLFSYVANIVDWDKCSAVINLGDVITGTYVESTLIQMNNTLAPIPNNKKINIIGNHDTWGDWRNDSSMSAPSQDFWNELLSYFDNSRFDGYMKYGTHQTAESMIDEEHLVKYVVIGGWDYDKSKGGYSHYVISPGNLDAIISALSVIDDYDIILLSHIQPFNETKTSKVWYRPAVDGGSESSSEVNVGTMVHTSDTSLNALFNARKNKTAGTVNDSYGNAHAFDFSACTSDLLCTLHGHQHTDRYKWNCDEYDLPTMIFDALHYDHQPFYFVNIDRHNQRINVWKVDDSPIFYNFQVPFTKPVEL